MEKLKHPHSSNVLKVIQAFESVLPMAIREGHLNMLCANVSNGNYMCGTIHCHAGWFTLGIGNVTKGLLFEDGVQKMNEILGFGSIRSIYSGVCSWADKNPEIWGNRNGDYMFSHASAFESSLRMGGALNLQHIIDHWKEVYERLKALEQPSNPYPISASKELAVKAMEETLEIDFPVKEAVNNQKYETN